MRNLQLPCKHNNFYIEYLFLSHRDGDGIHLDEDLDKGYSHTCKTFNNAPLVSNDEGRFQCQLIEALVFEDKGSHNGQSAVDKSPKK